jgi:PAS domain S-box-containing protein
VPLFSTTDALLLMQGKDLDLPFIVVSGKIGEDAAVALMKAGAHDYVMKNNLTRLGPPLDRGLREVENRRDKGQDEEALRETKEKYRSILENSVQGIFRSTLEGRVQTANPEFAHILGYASPEELIASVTAIGYQLYAKPGRWKKFIEQIRRHGAVSNFETLIVRGDGSFVWISIKATLFTIPMANWPVSRDPCRI